MWRRTWRGAFHNAVESIVAISDVVLPAEGHKVVLKTFLKREISIRCQGSDGEVGALCWSGMAGYDIESGMDNFVVVLVHRLGRLG